MWSRAGLVALALMAWWLAPGRASGAESLAPWAAHLQTADAALSRGALGEAAQEWRRGLAAALRGRTWLGLLEVGDAYMRIAEAGAFPGSAKPMARSLYLEALVQAKSQRSPEGILRVAAAFDRLGDRSVVEQCVMVAESVANRRRDFHALHEVSVARERLALPIAVRRESTR